MSDNHDPYSSSEAPNSNNRDRRSSSEVPRHGSRSRRSSSEVPPQGRESRSSSIHGTPERRKLSVTSESNDNLALLKAVMKKRQQIHSKNKAASDFTNYCLITLVFLITILGMPMSWGAVTVHHVFYYGWLTAVSTGLGAVPFFFISEPNHFWVGISNAIAGGMMLAASHSLFHEGMEFHTEEFGILSTFKNLDLGQHSFTRTVCGFVLGILFIVVTKKVLDRYEDLSLEDVQGANAQRMVLIIFVMTLHSLSEGIGIGVSFGGKSGMQLGHFISMSLAMHNVPEGLAVALVMTSRKVGTLRTVLWAIATSLPQPIFAVPAYLFVERFSALLPGGLGFAAGAMTYVALFELLVESFEDTKSVVYTGVATVAACAAMSLLQEAVKVTI